jgi:hypothetical protein
MNQINFKPDLLKPTAMLEYHDAVMCMMVYDNLPTVGAWRLNKNAMLCCFVSFKMRV